MAEPFLVVGAMKCGTTTLHQILSEHAEVDVVAEKEGNTLHSSVGAHRLARLIAASPAPRAGEVTAGYMQAPLLPQPTQLARDLFGPDLRILAIVRDPFDRAVSHWRHWSRLGRERGGAEVILEPKGPYVAFSRFHAQLDPWVCQFGPDAVEVVALERYQRDPARTLGAVWSHLGVDAAVRAGAAVHANALGQQRLASGWRGRIARSSLYRDHVRPLVPHVVRRAAVPPSAVTTPPPALSASDLQDLRNHFVPLVRDDQERLISSWPAARPLEPPGGEFL